mmetsp:Transcript_49824/g.106057  ORF Transcript_49824/g.106057 Transcript_49824/m.106057 type:complete len:102 (-) Transcript_49824:23-328(-)
MKYEMRYGMRRDEGIVVTETPALAVHKDFSAAWLRPNPQVSRAWMEPAAITRTTFQMKTSDLSSTQTEVGVPICSSSFQRHAQQSSCLLACMISFQPNPSP